MDSSHVILCDVDDASKSDTYIDTLTHLKIINYELPFESTSIFQFIAFQKDT